MCNKTNFVSRAPAAVVETERAKLAEMQAELAAVEQQIVDLEAAV